MNSNRPVESDIFEIEGYQVILSKNIVQFQGEELSATPKMLSVLRVLAENQGQTVSKAILLNCVWGETVTTDMVLSRAISDLRKLFDDSARKQNFISTISKQGYCLNKPVKWHKQFQEKKSVNKKAVLLTLVFLFPLIALLINASLKKNKATFPLEHSSAPLLKNITADKIDQRYARFSRDGLKLAYLEKSEQNKNFRVLVRILANEQIDIVKEYIDRADILAINFAFSTDGTKLAIKELTSSGCRISIIQMANLDENILDTCPESPIASIDWFPNSSELLITNYDKESEIVGLAKLNIDSEKLSHYEIDYPEPLGLLFPRISEAGASILLVSIEPRSEQWGVAIFEPASGKLDFVLNTEHKINQVVWHHSDKSFFYVVEAGEQPGVWYYDLETKINKHIHTIDRNIRDLDFNIRGNQFAYIQEEYYSDIWRISMDSEGKITDNLVGLPSSQNSNPNLSPNEKLLALISSGRGQHELLIYDIQAKRILLRYQKENMKFIDISWSPDNRYILLTASEEEKKRLYKVEITSGSATQIKTAVEYNPSRARWSSNNNVIYWSEQQNGKWRLAELDSKGNRQHLEVDLNQEYLFTEDGAVLYKEGGNYLAQNSIFVCRLELDNCNSHLYGEDEEVLVRDRYLSGWDYKNETVFYTLFDSQTLGYTLYKMPLSTKLAQPMYSLERDAIARSNQMSMSSDEKTLYYTKKQRISFDIILMNQPHS